MNDAVIRVPPRTQAAGWLLLAAVLFVVLGPTDLAWTPGALLAVGLVAVLEASEVQLPHSPSGQGATITDAGVVTAILLLTPVTALLAVAIGLVVGQAWRRRGWLKSAFNLGQHTVAVAVAAATYDALAGDTTLLSGRSLAALVVAVVVWSLINWSATAAVVSSVSGEPWWGLVTSDLAVTIRSTIGAVTLGLLAAFLWRDTPGAVVLILVPLAAIHLAQRLLVERELLLVRVGAERDQLQTAVTDATDGIALRGADGAIELWSPAMARLTGIPTEEALGAQLQELALFAAAANDPRPGRSAPYDLTVDVHPQPRHLEVSHRGRGEPGQRPAGDVITVTDVTARVEADRLKDDFLARVSHELRTPLTAIAGFAKTLVARQDQLEPQRQRRLLERIDDRAGHMARLIDDLLFVAARRPGPAREPQLFDLGGRVAALTEDLGGGSHELRVRARPGTWVRADPHAVDQIVGNLLSNAVKYSPTGSTIDVEVDRDEDEARVAVTDRGPGIPASLHDAIFDRFYRAEDPLTMRTSGTGLGLYIARELAIRVGGSLAVASAPGAGATFTLTVPAFEPPPGTPSSDAPPSEPVDHRG